MKVRRILAALLAWTVILTSLPLGEINVYAEETEETVETVETPEQDSSEGDEDRQVGEEESSGEEEQPEESSASEESSVPEESNGDEGETADSKEGEGEITKILTSESFEMEEESYETSYASDYTVNLGVNEDDIAVNCYYDYEQYNDYEEGYLSAGVCILRDGQSNDTYYVKKDAKELHIQLNYSPNYSGNSSPKIVTGMTAKIGNADAYVTKADTGYQNCYIVRANAAGTAAISGNVVITPEFVEASEYTVNLGEYEDIDITIGENNNPDPYGYEYVPGYSNIIRDWDGSKYTSYIVKGAKELHVSVGSMHGTVTLKGITAKIGDKDLVVTLDDESRNDLYTIRMNDDGTEPFNGDVVITPIVLMASTYTVNCGDHEDEEPGWRVYPNDTNPATEKNEYGYSNIVQSWDDNSGKTVYYVAKDATAIHVAIGPYNKMKAPTATINGDPAIVTPVHYTTGDTTRLHHYMIEKDGGGVIDGNVVISPTWNTYDITFEVANDDAKVSRLCTVEPQSKSNILTSKVEDNKYTFGCWPGSTTEFKITIANGFSFVVKSGSSQLASSNGPIANCNIKADSDKSIIITTTPKKYTIPVKIRDGKTNKDTTVGAGINWSNDGSDFTQALTNGNIITEYKKNLFLRVIRVIGYEVEKVLLNNEELAAISNVDGAGIYKLYETDRLDENGRLIDNNFRLATNASITVVATPHDPAKIEAIVNKDNGPSTDKITLSGGSNAKASSGTAYCEAQNTDIKATYTLPAGRAINDVKVIISDGDDALEEIEPSTSGDFTESLSGSTFTWTLSKDKVKNLWDTGRSARFVVDTESAKYGFAVSAPEGVTLKKYTPSSKDSSGAVTAGSVGSELSPDDDIFAYGDTLRFVAEVDETTIPDDNPGEGKKYSDIYMIDSVKFNGGALTAKTDTFTVNGVTKSVKYYETGAITKKPDLQVTKKVKVAITGLSFVSPAVTIGTGSDHSFRQHYVVKVKVTPATASIPELIFTSTDPSLLDVEQGGSSSSDGTYDVVLTACDALSASSKSVTLTAKAADGSNKFATCTVTVAQVAESIVIPDSQPMFINESKTITPVFNGGPDHLQPANKTVIWQWDPADQKVATITSAGVIKAVAGGSAKVKAVWTDGKVTTESGWCQITVTEAVSSISLNATSKTLLVGKDASGSDTFELVGTALKNTATNRNLKFTTPDYSDDPDECILGLSSSGVPGEDGSVTATLTPTGLAFPNNATTRTAVVTVTAQDGSGKTATCNVTMERRIWSVSISEDDFIIAKGKTKQLTPVFNEGDSTRQPHNKALKWTSSNPGVASVNATTGVVTAVSAGKATISVESVQNGKDGKPVKSEKSVEVEVINPVTGVKFASTAYTVPAASDSSLCKTVDAQLVFTPSFYQVSSSIESVEYVLSDDEYLTFADWSEKATIKAKAPLPAGTSGSKKPVTLTVKVTTRDGVVQTATCTLNITEVTDNIVIDSSKALLIGESYTLKPEFNDGLSVAAPASTALEWHSSDETRVKVSAAGVISAVAGTIPEEPVKVWAVAKDSGKESNDCQVTVTEGVSSITLNATAKTLLVGKDASGSDTFELVGTALKNTASNKNLLFASPDYEDGYLGLQAGSADQEGKTTATLNPTGKAFPNNATTKTAVVTVTAKDGSEKTAKCTVTMERCVWSLALAEDDLTILMGRTQKLTPLFNVDNLTSKQPDLTRQPKNTGLVWKCSDMNGDPTNVVTVANGVVTAKKGGKAKVWAESVQTKGGSVIRSNDVVVEVTEPVGTVTFTTPATINLLTGTDSKLQQSFDVAAVAGPVSATEKGVEFFSSNEDYLTVTDNNDGTATIQTTGVLPAKSQKTSVKVTARAVDGSGKSTTATVNINQAVEQIEIPDRIIIVNGKTATPTVVYNRDCGIQPVNKNITWSIKDVSPEGAITINEKTGAITAVKDGTATVVATAELFKVGDQTVKVESNECSVTAYEPVTAIKLDQTALTLFTGSATEYQQTGVLTATLNGGKTTPSNGELEFTVSAEDSEYLDIIPGDDGLSATLVPTGKLPAGKTNTSVTVTAKSTDGTNKTATCKVTLKQRIETVDIDDAVEIMKGKSVTIGAILNEGVTQPDNRTLKWTTSDSSVATVNGTTGLVQGKKKGTATITATAEFKVGSDTVTVSDECIVTVSEPVSAIAFVDDATSGKTITAAGIYAGSDAYRETKELTVKLTPPDAAYQEIEFTSSNPAYLTVDPTAVALNGIATVNVYATGALPSGKTKTDVKVTAKATDGSGKVASITMNITQPIEEIGLSENIRIKKNQQYTLQPRFNMDWGVQPDNKTLEWKSSDTSVATVDKGVVKGLKPGTAIITAKAPKSPAESNECYIEVFEPVTRIAFNKTATNIYTGSEAALQDSEDLKMTVTPSTATCSDIEYTVTNENKNDTNEYLVVESGEDGAVTFRTTGLIPDGKTKTTVTVTARTVDGTNLSTTCKVTIKQCVETIEISADEDEIMKGKTLKFAAVVKGNQDTVNDGISPDDKSILWYSTDKSVASVNAQGIVTGTKAGTATIYAVSKDGKAKSNEYEVEVFDPVMGVSLDKTKVTLGTGKESEHRESAVIKATAVPNTAKYKDIYYSVANAADAAYLSIEDGEDGTAILTPTGVMPAGKATYDVKVTATSTDGTNKSAVCIVTLRQRVEKVEVKLPNSKGVIRGRSQAMTLIFNDGESVPADRSVTWTILNNETANATISQAGVLSTKNAGDIVVRATAKDGDVYGECNVKIFEPVTTITLDHKSLSLGTGSAIFCDPETIEATVNDSAQYQEETLEFECSQNDSTYLTVTNNGNGTATLRPTGVLPARQSKVSVRVTAKATDGSGKTAVCTVDIYQHVEQVTLPEGEQLLNINKTMKLNPVFNKDRGVQPVNRNVTWSIVKNDAQYPFDDNDPVIKIDSKTGLITALKEGRAKVRVTTEDGGIYADSVIRVIVPVTSIKLTAAPAPLLLGMGSQPQYCDEGELLIEFTPSNASIKALTFESSNETLLKVVDNDMGDGKGHAILQPQAVKLPSGTRATVRVTVRTTDGSNKSATCNVTLFQRVESFGIPATQEIARGKSYTLPVTFNENASTPDNRAIKWKIKDGQPADVISINEKTGLIRALKQGSVVIEATSEDNTTEKHECSVTVVEPVTNVRFVTSSMTVKTDDDNKSIGVTVLPIDATDPSLTFTSSDEDYLIVSPSDGKVDLTLKKSDLPNNEQSHTVKVTAKSNDGTNRTATCNVTIQQRVTSVDIPDSLSLLRGKTYTLQPRFNEGTSNPYNKGVTWTSSNPTAVSVSSNGMLTARKSGESAVITVTSKEDGSKFDECTVTVNEPVSSIKLNKAAINLKTGSDHMFHEPFTLEAEVDDFATATKAELEFTTNSEYLQVVENGDGTAKIMGAKALPKNSPRIIAKVTVRATDGSNKTAVCTVTLEQQAEQISLPTDVTLKKGRTYRLDPVFNDNTIAQPYNRTVIWSSDNEDVATVSDKGVVTAKSVGTANIKATVTIKGDTTEWELNSNEFEVTVTE